MQIFVYLLLSGQPRNVLSLVPSSQTIFFSIYMALCIYVLSTLLRKSTTRIWIFSLYIQGEEREKTSSFHHISKTKCEPTHVQSGKISWCLHYANYVVNWDTIILLSILNWHNLIEFCVVTCNMHPYPTPTKEINTISAINPIIQSARFTVCIVYFGVNNNVTWPPHHLSLCWVQHGLSFLMWTACLYERKYLTSKTRGWQAKEFSNTDSMGFSSRVWKARWIA